MPQTRTLIGYTRVSTNEQADSGLGLAAQEEAIRSTCERNGWHLTRIVRDEGQSGKDLARPGVQEALGLIATGKAWGLVVSRLDRLSRSVIDLAGLLEWFTRCEAHLVALDLGIDTSTPAGRMMATVFASVAQWERETIGARTRESLAALRAQGRPVSRPAVADVPGLPERIQDMRAAGMTLHAIADALEADGVPTLRGGLRWRPSSVQATLGYRRPRAPRRAVEMPEVRRRKKRNPPATACPSSPRTPVASDHTPAL